MFVELRLHEPEREARGPDLLNRDLAQEIRQRPDVVFVPVREDDGANRPLPLAQVREVRKDQIDTQVLVAGEREACVDDDRIVAALVDHHVLPDLAEAAQGNDPQSSVWHRLSLAPVSRR